MATFQCIVEILSGLLTPLIAVIAVWIAWRQHKTDKDSFRHALYDKRFAVYRGSMTAIEAALTNGRIDLDDVVRLDVSTQEGGFLFGDDVNGHLIELRQKALDFRFCGNRLANKNYKNEEERECLVKQNGELLEWFNRQLAETFRVFRPYLWIKS